MVSINSGTVICVNFHKFGTGYVKKMTVLSLFDVGNALLSRAQKRINK